MNEKKAAPKKAVKKAAKKAPAKKAAKKTTSTKKTTEKKSASVKKQTKSSAPEVQPKVESFKNNLVDVEMELNESCEAHLTVEIKKELLTEAYTKAVKETSKSVSVPGFRKGKVPKEMIEKNYAEHIDEQYKNGYLQKSLEQALVLTNLKPLNYRNIKPKIVTQDKSEATVTFSFETYPVVPSIDIGSLKLKKVEAEEVDQAKIDDVIDVMRTYRAKWTPIEDRAVEKGDFVEVDIENVEDGTKIVSQKRVQVAKGKLSAWITKLLIGLKKGESKEGTSKWDDEVMPESEKKDFKPTKCKVTVLEVYDADLPEVDEAFAKAMGTQSVADLRTQVMIRLKKNAEEIANAKMRDQLDDQLENLVEFNMPATLIDAEVKTKIQLREQELKQANLSDKDIEKRSSEIEADAKENAVRSLKLFFVLQKLANDHNIIVPEQELRQQVAEKVSQLNLPAEFKSSPQFTNHFIQEIRMNCFVELLTDKVKSYLLKKVAYA